MEDPTITTDMDRLKCGLAMLEYNEFQQKQEAELEKNLKNQPKFKMPKNADEILKMLLESIKR